MRKLLFIYILAFVCNASFSQVKIAVKEASKHIGDSVTIIDKVSGVQVLNNGIMLLNLGGVFPNHLLTVMIRPADIQKFAFKPAGKLKGKPVVVSGKLIDYKDKPGIIVTDPAQLEELSQGDPRLSLQNFK
ncbi:hypothetical protein GS399_19385 [Pedobacter sp. HMF7647]|uniref:DUF4369 domain-containing protein n=1 Tax=Hufsiella arboris TaxID=2695275 RepID=A0A7K1YEW2_9SPHI|nr:hypothetical protein [Hufsiella arboris]MXV53135.1 hypothetical protein [Hufsiella arboris]